MAKSASTIYFLSNIFFVVTLIAVSLNTSLAACSLSGLMINQYFLALGSNNDDNNNNDNNSNNNNNINNNNNNNNNNNDKSIEE